MAGLIVSVRDAAEALVALENGASLIDVKEPSRGALGKADDDVIRAVIDAVAGRAPVSVAMGELADDGLPWPRDADGATFTKWGLHAANANDWRMLIRWLWTEALQPAVPCAYADVSSDETPSADEVCRFAVENRSGVFLIDTFNKDGRSLLDHLALPDLSRIAERCRDAGVKLALAGSLTADAIRTLLPLAPEWFAVRGAACEGGREGRISGERVRALAALCRAGGDPTP